MMIEDTRDEEYFEPPEYKECPACGGEGYLIDDVDNTAYTCRKCRGTGEIKV